MALKFSSPGFIQVIVCAVLMLGSAWAADPIESQRRVLGGGRITSEGGATIVAPVTPRPQVTIVYFTAVSPARQWTASDGRTMVGRLMAFSAPKPNETGPVEVIRNGNVSFLRSGAKKPVEFSLEKLSEADRKYVRAIADAAKNGVPEDTTLPQEADPSLEPAAPGH